MESLSQRTRSTSVEPCPCAGATDRIRSGRITTRTSGKRPRTRSLFNAIEGCNHGVARQQHPDSDSWARDVSPPERACESLARRLQTNLVATCMGGFTLDPRSGASVEFDEQTYFVSLQGYERRFSSLPTQPELCAWLRGCWTTLRRSDFFVGGWPNPGNGLFYLDVSVAVQGRRAAEAFGKFNSQLTIYHPTTNAVTPITRQPATIGEAMTEAGIRC